MSSVDCDIIMSVKWASRYDADFTPKINFTTDDIAAYLIPQRPVPTLTIPLQLTYSPIVRCAKDGHMFRVNRLP